MVRLSAELLNDAPQYINTLNDRELQLRNYKIPVIENMGVTRDQFDTIDMTDNDVKKLENFPMLKRLRHFHLHNNRIQSAFYDLRMWCRYIDPKIATQLPNLKTLTLTNNNLCELGDIDALAGCKNLEYLSFIGNPITHKEHYRLYVIYRVPNVRVLDFKRVRLSERQAAQKLFKGKKNARLRDEVGKKSAMVIEDEAKAATRAGNVMSDEDRAKIQEAIANAKSMAEVDYLQALLQSGRVPDKGWNKQLEFSAVDKENQKSANGGFQPESEDAMET